MATNKNAPKVFTSLLNDTAATPAPTPTPPKKGNGSQLAFFIDAELKRALDRIVFWHPQGASQRAVLQELMATIVQQHPDAQRPMPREQNQDA